MLRRQFLRSVALSVAIATLPLSVRAQAPQVLPAPPASAMVFVFSDRSWFRAATVQDLDNPFVRFKFTGDVEFGGQISVASSVTEPSAIYSRFTVPPEAAYNMVRQAQADGAVLYHEPR